jgi:hypothetical protein
VAGAIQPGDIVIPWKKDPLSSSVLIGFDAKVSSTGIQMLGLVVLNTTCNWEPIVKSNVTVTNPTAVVTETMPVSVWYIPLIIVVCVLITWVIGGASLVVCLVVLYPFICLVCCKKRKNKVEDTKKDHNDASPVDPESPHGVSDSKLFLTMHPLHS